MGLTLLIDLVIRSVDIRAFYTDEGVLPRFLLHELYGLTSLLSVHFYSGETGFQILLFIFAMISALALLIGYKTRMFTVLSWIFLISIQRRNPLLLQSGDHWLRLLLFWGLFLPWGDRYAIDRSKKSSHRSVLSACSAGTVALYLQFLIVYGFSFINKFSGSDWRNGSAVYYALNLDLLAKPFGQFLLNQQFFLPMATYGVLYLQLFGPLAFFFPYRTSMIRLGVMGLLSLMQLLLGLCLKVGLFPLIAIVAMLGFIPADFWTWVTQFKKKYSDVKPESVFNTSDRISAPANHAVWMRAGFNGLVSLALFLSFLSSLHWSPSFHYTPPLFLERLTKFLALEQRWSMFAPNPPRDDGWIVAEGIQRSVNRIDLFRKGQKVSWVKPDSVLSLFPNYRWQHIALKINIKKPGRFLKYWANYYCREWNRGSKNKDEKVDQVRLYWLLEKTPLPFHEATPIEKIILWQGFCFLRCGVCGWN